MGKRDRSYETRTEGSLCRSMIFQMHDLVEVVLATAVIDGHDCVGVALSSTAKERLMMSQRLTGGNLRFVNSMN